MTRTRLLQEIRKMRFAEAYESWNSGRLSQHEAAHLLGMSERNFRRYLVRYESEGIEGLADRRLDQFSHRRAPVDEVLKLVDLYRVRYSGWNVKHFHSWYRRVEGGERSYTWVKNQLQKSGLVEKSQGKGLHRKRRDRKPVPGMMIHQDGSEHEWVSGKKWDLIVTMDDATNEHYDMRFVEEEGTLSSFQGLRAVILKHGLPCSFYSDRGSHYWLTAEAGKKVDKSNLTQFGRAMKHLGIEMIPAYSPQARGRSERAFRTHQERLPRELSLLGITSLSEANAYLAETYCPQFNGEFSVLPREEGNAFVPWVGSNLDDILCEQYDRTVGNDNCVRFEGLVLQIPSDRHRHHYVKVKVRVHRYADETLAIFHGPRRLAYYTDRGKLVEGLKKAA